MSKQNSKSWLVLIRHPYLLLIGLGILVFFNTLFNNFVWLDNVFITNNPVLLKFDLIHLLQNNHTTTGGYFRPLTTIYYAIVYNLGVNQPFLFHVFQISFRITGACLLFGIFNSFFNRKVALFLAAVYLVHPLNQSVTAFISNSADSLYMSFGIVALYLVVKNKLHGMHRFLIFALLCSSILAKESGVLFFGVILLYIFLFRKKERLFYTIGETATLGLYLWIRHTSHVFVEIDASLIPLMQLPLLERLLSIPPIIFYYVKNFFMPLYFGINSFWYVKSLSLQYFFIPLISSIVFFLGLGILGFYTKKKLPNLFKTYIFFLFFFCFGLSAYLQIIPLDYTVASRWFIFPMIGLLGLLGIFFEFIQKYRHYFFAIAATIIILLSWRTMFLNTVWNNNVSLFHYAVSKNPNYFNTFALAGTLYAEGQYKEALVYVKQSEKKFEYDVAYALEGNIHTALHDEKNAGKAYEASLQLHEISPHPYNELSYVSISKYLLRKDDYTKAEKLLYEGASAHSNSETIWILLSYAEHQLGNYDKATSALKQAYSINQRNPLSMHLHEYTKREEPIPSSITDQLLN